MSLVVKDVQRLLISDKVSIRETIKAIEMGGFGIVLVVDEKKRLCGVVSDGDVRRAILKGVGLGELVVEVMNDKPIAVDTKWGVRRINKYLLGKQVLNKGRFELLKLPVIDEKKRVVDFLVTSPEELISGQVKLVGGRKRIRRVKKVLIIGGSGYIGSVMVRVLLHLGFRVSVLDSFFYGKRSLKGLGRNKNVNLIKGDTRHIEDVMKALDGVDAVVQLAELVGDPAASVNPQLTQEINFLATTQVASICKHCQINRFIYFSSCSVYGASAKGALLTEESALNPVSLYARMKIETEQGLLAMMDDSFFPTIVRLATVYGKSYRPRFDLIVNFLTAKAVVEGEIPVFGGKQWRPHVHVRDVAAVVGSMLDCPLEQVGGQIFNLGRNGQNLQMLELAQIIESEVPGAKIKVAHKDSDKRSYKVDFSKLEEVLNPPFEFEVPDGVREIKADFDKGRVKDYQEADYSNHQMVAKLFS